MRRIFAAIDIPCEARQRVADHIELLRRSFKGPGVRWEPIEKLHLTVRFIGDVDNDQVEKISQILARTGAALTAFELCINSTGAFPAADRPRVLWLGLQDTTASVARAKDQIDAELGSVGVAADRRPLKPHFTIARIRRTGSPINRLALNHLAAKFEPVSFKVCELILYESTLLPTGSVYSIVSRHPLG